MFGCLGLSEVECTSRRSPSNYVLWPKYLPRTCFGLLGVSGLVSRSVARGEDGGNGFTV